MEDNTIQNKIVHENITVSSNALLNGTLKLKPDNILKVILLIKYTK